MPSAADSKANLEARKLRGEIRKLTAEAKKAELEVMTWQRDECNTLAENDQHHYYPFMGPVDGSTAKAAIATLTKWGRRDPGCDISIVFNSPGGSVIDGLALYDCIAELKAKGHKFTTVARGYAASMGGILLQAGDERVIGANAHMLIHEISSGAIGKFSEIKDEVAFLTRLQDRCVGILAERSTLTARQIKRKWERTDWWLDADETVRLGFADRIG